jgi:DNA-binding IclR family transcriptional regulator
MPKELLNVKQYIERLRPSLRNDEIILRILGQVGIPTPFNFICELSGLRKGQAYRILSTLEKFGYIQKSTIAKSSFYIIKKGVRNER